MSSLTLAAFLVTCAFIAVFFGAVRARLFSRLENGFLLKMILAIAGLAVLSASALGIWGYEAGKEIVHQEVVGGLGNVGDLVEANLLQTIHIQAEQLSQFAHSLSDKLSP